MIAYLHRVLGLLRLFLLLLALCEDSDEGINQVVNHSNNLKIDFSTALMACTTANHARATQHTFGGLVGAISLRGGLSTRVLLGRVSTCTTLLLALWSLGSIALGTFRLHAVFVLLVAEPKEPLDLACGMARSVSAVYTTKPETVTETGQQKYGSMGKSLPRINSTAISNKPSIPKIFMDGRGQHTRNAVRSSGLCGSLVENSRHRVHADNTTVVHAYLDLAYKNS